MKKPGTGIPAGRMSEIVGRRLRRSLAIDEQLRFEDLDPSEAAPQPGEHVAPPR
jgi:hypothetical protein